MTGGRLFRFKIYCILIHFSVRCAVVGSHFPCVCCFFRFVCLFVCLHFFSLLRWLLKWCIRTQRVMETAEQAALSDSERDSAHHHHHHQAQTQHRLYETRHLNDYLSDDTKDLPPKPMRRFEKLIVNLTHSSVLAPAGISLSGTNAMQCNWFEIETFSNKQNASCSFLFNKFHIENRFQYTIVGCMVNTFRSDICKQFGTRCRTFMAIFRFDKWFYATLSRHIGKEIDEWFSYTRLVHSGSFIAQGYRKFQLHFSFVHWMHSEHLKRLMQ